MRSSDSDADATLLAPELTEDATGDDRRIRDPHHIPSRLGHYVLLDKLGAGAMGVVHAAYDTKLDRKVAIKLLQARGSEQARQRLVREARAMARVSHPNIVQIYEIGDRDEDALAFIVMEFVDGVTLRQWFTQRQRSRVEVLEVLRAAGRGLVAAHAEGLVHRDFKPDNVMVRRDGRVLVMDFGLARGDFGDLRDEPEPQSSAALVEQLTSSRELAPNLTATGAMLGTPAYMAPEQFHGRQADARTDQFAFCVTVWEALYRQRPFAGPSMAELSRAVTSGQLSTPPRGEVPGWLQAVLTRGLAVDPADRWPSMQALLDALQRDPTQRRRVALAIAGTIGLLLASFAGVQWQRTHTRERAIAACEAQGQAIDEVWNDARRAELESRFLATQSRVASSAWARAAPAMDAYAREWAQLRTSSCVAATVEETLAATTHERMNDCLAERRETFAGVVDAWREADEKTVVGASMAAAGLPPLSMCSNEAWLAQRKRPPPELAAEVAAVRARLERVRGLQLAGRYELALSETQALERDASELAWAPLIAELALARGRALENLGKYEDARAALEEALFEAIGSGHDLVALMAASTLTAVVGHQLAQHQPAHRWHRLAFELLERLELQGTHYEAELLADGSRLQYSEGAHEQAIVDLERALAIYEAAFGPDHLLNAGVLNQIGNAAWELGQHERALAAHRRALALREAALGPTHPLVAGSLNNIGLVLWEDGEYEQALVAHRRALAIYEASFEPGHVEIGSSHNNIGLVQWSQGARDEALQSFAAALEIWEAELGSDHPDVALVHNNFGLVLAENGQLEAALAAHQRALAIYEKAFGPKHHSVALSHHNIGVVLRDQGQLEGARAAFERALPIYEATVGSTHPDVAMCMSNLGTVLARLGELEAARDYQQRALTIRESMLGLEHPDVAISLQALGDLAVEDGDDVEARVLFERALEIRRKAKVAPESIATTQFSLARVLWRLGEHEVAREHARASLALIKREADVRMVEAWLREH